jgi:hypothetical protein
VAPRLDVWRKLKLRKGIHRKISINLIKLHSIKNMLQWLKRKFLSKLITARGKNILAAHL